MRKAILFVVAGWLGASAPADVADLEQMQATNASIVLQYTFDGTYAASNGTGTWLEDTIGAVDLSQDLFEAARIADQQTGYDGSSKCANFDAWASGGKGDGLTSGDSSITFSTSGTIEYLVQIGTMDSSSHFMVCGDGAGGSNDRFYFLLLYGGGMDTAQMTIGENAPEVVIGGSLGVAYNDGDWYYVAQTWDISGGSVTFDAWAANLTAGGSLIHTVDGAVNTFAGDTVAELYLANLIGLANYFADGGLDALAVYDAQLSESTILSHFNAVATPAPPVAAVSNISAAYRNGQVFIQWDEALENVDNLKVYMHSVPITSNNLASAQLVEQRIEPHSANDWYDDPDECPKAYGPVHGWVIEDNGAALNRQNGLFVHTVESTDLTNAYFAVLAESQGAADLTAGGNSMTQSVAVSVAPIEAIWQLGPDTVDWGAASNQPLALYLHPHTSRPTGGQLTYLVFGDKTMGWRGGLPFKFKVDVLTNENVVLVQPYNRMWINRKLGVSETYESYNRLYRNIETWHYGTSDKIYDPVERYNGTVVNYTERLYLWMLDWVEKTYQTDTNKVYAYGTSMGTGAQPLVLRNPDRFASVDLLVPIVDWSYEDGTESNAKRLEAACGPMWMPTSDGVVLSNRMNMIKFVQEATYDLPHVTIRVGRQDASVYWARKPPYMAAMQASRHGFLAGWDNGDHGTAMRSSIAAFPDFQDYSYAISNFALNLSYPAFSDFSMNEDPGNGDKTDGDIVGFINRGLEWFGIVDQPDRYEVTIQSTHPDTVYPVTMDVTLRNLQNFDPRPGEMLRVRNRDGTGAVVDEKTVTVGSNGLLTCDAFSVTSAEGNTLTVARPGFMFMLMGQ